MNDLRKRAKRLARTEHTLSRTVRRCDERKRTAVDAHELAFVLATRLAKRGCQKRVAAEREAIEAQLAAEMEAA